MISLKTSKIEKKTANVNGFTHDFNLFKKIASLLKRKDF